MAAQGGPTPESPMPYPDESAPKRQRSLGALCVVGGLFLLGAGIWSLPGPGLPVAVPCWLAGIAAIVFGALRMVKAAKAIRRLETAWVLSRGWTWTDRDTSDRPNRFLGFRPFGQGHTRVACNIVTGTYWGVPFEAFNYSYQETHTSTDGRGHTTQHTTTYPFAIVAVPMPVQAPGLTLEPETFGKKVFDALGGEDIDFESDDFSRKFWVRCPDRKFAYDAISPAIMEHLMAVGNKRTWEWRGPRLLVWTPGSMGIRDLDRRLWEVQGFVSRIPRQLLQAPPAKVAV